MKSKLIAILISSIVLSSALIGTGINFIVNSNVIATVKWDDPKSSIDEGIQRGYNISRTAPTKLELFTTSESPGVNLGFDFLWTYERNISLIWTGERTYHAYFTISYKSDRRYFLKISRTVNNINIVDNLTLIELNPTLKTNKVTLHYWKNLYIVKKPAIYLYHEDNQIFHETLSVFMPNGEATLTIPEIPLGQTITWENFQVYPESQISFNGEIYPYLFYEAAITQLDFESLKHGWVIQNKEGNWTVNNKPINDLEIFFASALGDLGLFESEIADFLQYWCEEKKLFDAIGTYIMRQIPLEIVNDQFQLETINTYKILRVFFTCSYSPETDILETLLPLDQVYHKVNTGYTLHEWGLLFDSI